MTMTKPTSEQVTFLASGAGATQRTALEKFRDVVSVKDFGAVGNNVADDTAAIQAALNTGKRVYFPNGTYVTSAAITMSSANQMIGESIASTIIKCSGAHNAVTITDTSVIENYNCRIENMSFNGNSVGIVGIQVGSGLNFSARHQIRSVAVYGFTSHGIHMLGCSYTTVYEGNVSSNGGDGIRIELGLYGGSNTIEGGNFFDNGSYNINLENKAHYNAIIRAHCYYQSGTRTSNLRINNSHHTSVFECTFENLGGTVASHIDVDDTDGATSPNTLANFINDCRFVGLSTFTTNNFRIGITGAVYQTQIDNCTVLQASGSDVLIGQYGYNTVISRSLRFTSYDTPTSQTELTVSNSFGNVVTNLPFSSPSGTFSPLLQSTTGTDVSATYSTQFGKYQRLGDRVFFDVALTVSGTSGTPGGSLVVTGFPIPIATGRQSSVSTFVSGLATPATYDVNVKSRVVSVSVQGSAVTAISITYSTSNTAMPATEVTTGTTVIISGSYLA
jgi:hypothetical protein